MVADSSIDGQFDWFFACFIVPLRFLATHALPASMAAYVYAMELWIKCVVQINRTFTAVMHSFCPETILFLEDDEHTYFPVVSFGKRADERRGMITGYHEWSYNVSKQQFIHNASETHRTFRLPYLGASLSCSCLVFGLGSTDTFEVGDLSEWIAEQTVVASTNQVPFQVLVYAWAHCNKHNITLGCKYHTLTVMNEDGDEVSYSLTHDDTDSESDDDAPQNISSSVSIASSTEETSGSIQMIGKRILPQTLYDLLVPSAPVNTPLPASPETVSSVSDDESCEEGEIKKDK